jgi:sulfur carrier protein
MEVIINHKTQQLQEKASLLHLLETQGLSEKKGIAVAVNNKVIPRAGWPSHTLNPNDSVTIIKATQGG